MTEPGDEDPDDPDDSEREHDELGQTPTLRDEFRALTPAHKLARNRINRALQAYADGDDCNPPAIRGPYRTGKTALQYHGFKEAWDLGVPALFVEANDLLDEFDASDNGSFEAWVLDRVQKQVDALINRGYENVEWIPTGSESQADRREWFEDNVHNNVDTDRYVLFIDEVEQEYKRFLSATGVDDDNPIRRLLKKSELLPVLSMGQLSAFEFVGEADLGRTEPISIPPVTIDHIEALLAKRGVDPELGRVIYWMTRGRAARVHQLVTAAENRSISLSDHETIAGWLASHAHEKSTEFKPVRQLWEDLHVDDPAAAAGAIAFDQRGRADWLVESESWYPAAKVVEIADEVLRGTDAFTEFEEDDVREGRRILRQSLEWVVNSMAAPADAVDGASDQRAMPSSWLSGERDGRSASEAFLSLVQDYLLAFEAERPARELAFDALEEAKGSFKRQYDAKSASVTGNEEDAWTVRPTVLEKAYPALATDPKRLTDQTTEELKDQMDRGVEVSVDEPASVYACPTEDAFEGQLQQLTPDPTHPVCILTDDEIDVEQALSTAPVASALRNHDVLNVVEVPTDRVWEFVVQLHGRFADGQDPYRADREQVGALLESVSSREDKTTIETLYDHLTSRVAAEAATETVEAHRRQFEAGDGPLWAHEDVAGPSWVNPGAEWSRGRHAVASLLVLGAEPDWDDYGELLNVIEEGLESDTITTKQHKFKELLSHIKGSGGYGKPAQTPRSVCRRDNDSEPTEVVMRVEGALDALVEASSYDSDEVLRGLFEAQANPDTSTTSPKAVDELLETFGPVVTAEHTTDVLWALTTATLVVDDKAYIESCLDLVLVDFNDLVQTLDGYLADVSAAEDVLAPDGVSNADGTEDELDALRHQLEQHVDEGTTEDTSPSPVAYGNGLELDASHIKEYRDNIESIRDSLRKAKTAAAGSPELRPTAYAIAVLASRYESAVRDAVDELEHATPTDGTVSSIENLRSEIQALVDPDERPAMSELSDEREAAVKSYADDVLDLQAIVNAPCVTVGNPQSDGFDVVRELDRTAEQRHREVQRLANELVDLAEHRQDAETTQQSVKRYIQALAGILTDPEEAIEPGPDTPSTAPDKVIPDPTEATDD